MNRRRYVLRARWYHDAVLEPTVVDLEPFWLRWTAERRRRLYSQKYRSAGVFYVERDRILR